MRSSTTVMIVVDSSTGKKKWFEFEDIFFDFKRDIYRITVNSNTVYYLPLKAYSPFIITTFDYLLHMSDFIAPLEMDEKARKLTLVEALQDTLEETSRHLDEEG